nr:Ppx/GppA family phosphatase [Propionibacterium sp.]
MTRRVAAIDCGTNSVRLLVAEADGSGFAELDRDLRLTRLGQGVDATGRFAPEALTRTLDAVADFAARIDHLGAERVRFVATSAARDASNREVFFAGVRALLGVEAEIISGDEEARLSFAGALSVARDVAWPVLVMDIGGGSTELVLGAVDAAGAPVVRAARSLDVGSVRLRERFLHSDPPTAAEVAAASRYVDELIAGSGVEVAAARTWIGVGGTATSLAAISLGLPTYDRARVDGAVLPRAAVRELADRLLGMPVAEVLRIPTMQPKRADVICGGALIAARVGDRCPVDLRVSEADILDGIVLDLLRPGGDAPGGPAL